MLGAMLIDDNGDCWPLGSPRLREILMCPDPDFDVADYAVRNLGYVLLRRQGRMVRAEMRPPLVKPVTLIGVYYSLIDLNPDQILLSRLNADESRHELFDDISEFAATLERDIEDDGVQRHRPTYALSSRSLRHLDRSRYARFAPIMQLWREVRGDMPSDLVPRLCRHGVQARAALVRNPNGTGRLVYEHVGSGYTFVGNACLPLTLIGEEIEMLPDREYGGWAARSYYECLADEAPRLETVSAVMRRSDGQRLWSYYDRVLLPWRGRGGTRFVLGLSEVRRRMLAA